jgi:hypothetical protein
MIPVLATAGDVGKDTVQDGSTRFRRMVHLRFYILCFPSLRKRKTPLPKSDELQMYITYTHVFILSSYSRYSNHDNRRLTVKHDFEPERGIV